MNRKLVISSQLFHWHKGIREFSSEASMLENEMYRQGWCNLDRRDGKWGFYMKSERTGRIIWFERFTEFRRDGELLSVTFRCSEPDLEVRCVVDND